MRKTSFFLLIASLLFLSGCFHQAEAPASETAPGKRSEFTSEQKTMEEKTDLYEITARYPETSSEQLNGQVNELIQSETEQIKQQSKGDQEFIREIGPYYVDISYGRKQYESLHSYVFRVDSYTGGAHPGMYFETFVFDARNEKLLSVGDLFTGEAYLDRLSELALQKLEEKGDLGWFVEGVAPEAQNFDEFSVGPEGITVHFSPYQVAAYAAGPQEILIGFEEVEEMLNPEVFNFRNGSGA